MHSPKQHLSAAKRVLRYVAGTVDFGSCYSKDADFSLIGYSDRDWAGSIDDRKTTSENVFSLGSGAIFWCSKKQDVVALSSSEAEYVAVTSAVCRAIWLRSLLVDVRHPKEGAMKVFCYNKAMIAMTKNLAFHRRTKHIDIRYHFIRNLTAKGEIELKFCSTKDQIADVLTKALTQAKHD
ncbi:secreted RxLR effector protein 161-like [Nicotiana tabacum]|uniref:Secreted RxLR effector protein 161-like n=1 Tax=Nicotiana tabacum TaxID=4097 RepID=A0AC58RX55_TOBAC